MEGEIYCWRILRVHLVHGKIGRVIHPARTTSRHYVLHVQYSPRIGLLALVSGGGTPLACRDPLAEPRDPIPARPSRATAMLQCDVHASWPAVACSL